MIDMVCPECGDEAEIDPADLVGAECIACEECEAEFAFTMVDGQLVLGEVLEPGTCPVCELPIRECTCEPEEDEEDGYTEIEVEDEDGDA